MKPPFAYLGGKSRIAPEIAGLLPSHDIYLEPFFGSGAVLFAKPPSRHEVVNDLNGDIACFFRVLRSQASELERVCRLTPYSRAEYDQARLEPSDDLPDLERARRWWVRVNQSFAKTARRNTGWSRTIAQSHSAPATIANRLARFAACAERLADVMIECTDAFDLIHDLGTNARADRTLIYLDPPYLADTRRTTETGAGTSAGKDYEIDMGHVTDHMRLAELLCSIDAAVVLSGYPSPLYDELYKGWFRHEIKVVAPTGRKVGGREHREDRVEVLWANRPLLLPGTLPFT